MKKGYAAIIAFILAADRLTKQWACRTLPPRQGGTLPVWQNVLHFTYVENRGAAFGLLQGQNLLFYVVTAVVTLALVWVLFVRKPGSIGAGIGMAMVLGGAWGNLYDRVVYGYVIDMIDFRLIHFAVFNVADAMICVGVAIWVLFYLFEDRANRAKPRDDLPQRSTADGKEQS